MYNKNPGANFVAFDQSEKKTNQHRIQDFTTEPPPIPPLGATLPLCPPEPAPPNIVAHNAKCPKLSVSATSTAASARPCWKSGSARPASCTANPAAPPATIKPRTKGALTFSSIPPSCRCH